MENYNVKMYEVQNCSITLGFRSLKRLIENSLLKGLARCNGKFELQAKEKQLKTTYFPHGEKVLLPVQNTGVICIVLGTY